MFIARNVCHVSVEASGPLVYIVGIKETNKIMKSKKSSTKIGINRVLRLGRGHIGRIVKNALFLGKSQLQSFVFFQKEAKYSNDKQKRFIS